jgi:hypothetical protein
MRTRPVTLIVTSLVLLLAASAAHAAPTELNVRIEGNGETLFEGPILTEGHDVASSTGTREDTEEHTCNGTNNKAHTTPGPTPTAVAVDALSLIGETFSGQWYSSFDDYLITRWGPDAEGEGAWHLVVNNVFTAVGGCQYELDEGSELLWVYTSSVSEPLLALVPVDEDYSSGARALTATATLDRPFEVEVLDYADSKEDKPPAVPERAGSSPYEGADVSPVKTAANGFEQIETASAETVTTNAQGKASITFTRAGWHRIKATVVKDGAEGALRSNRLDVCVPAEGATGCGTPPVEDQMRMPRYIAEQLEHEAETTLEEEAAKRQEEEAKQHEGKSEVLEYKATSTGGQTTGQGSETASPLRVQTPVFDGQGAAQGLIGVSWQILEVGVGLRSWTIASRTLGAADAGYVTRATGKSATSVLLALPPGAAYELEITFTDVLGRTSTATIGEVLVPYDTRWRGLHYRGHWRYLTQAGAWLDSASVGGAGARVSAALGAGRPVFMLRATSTAARVEVRAGTRRQVFVVARGAKGTKRQITAAERSHAGTVSLRVLQGTVDLDGVAVEP